MVFFDIYSHFAIDRCSEEDYNLKKCIFKGVLKLVKTNKANKLKPLWFHVPSGINTRKTIKMNKTISRNAALYLMDTVNIKDIVDDDKGDNKLGKKQYN